MPTIKINTCDRESFNRDFVFYDGKGNPMNILYDQQLDYYTGKLFFPENSSDTFKTLEINTFERIKDFEYQQYKKPDNPEDPFEDELILEKFQLFNTHGIELKGNRFSSKVKKIESVNNSEEFFSKWVYGEGVDNFFPIGTEVKFNRDIFDITTEKTYSVIQTKRNAILIITNQNNSDFTSSIGGKIEDKTQYENLKISGVNLIKIKDYITEDLSNNLPNWSEPNFYNKIFTSQKLNIVNSKEDNTGIFSVKDKNLADNERFSRKLFIDDLNGNLTIKVINKTNDINAYSGEADFKEGKNIIKLSKPVSSLLKPGKKFRVSNSKLNSKRLTISKIPKFNKTSVVKYFQEDQNNSASQVLFEGKIFKCVKTYKQTATSSITPKDTEFWEESDFVKVDEKLKDEIVLNSDIFLLTNEVDLNYSLDEDLTRRENISKCFEDFKETFSILGLDVLIDPLNSFVSVENKYPSDYIDVEFFIEKKDQFTGKETNGTNFSPTGYKFSYDPHPDTFIEVKVDGDVVPIGEDVFSSTDYGYFSNDGIDSISFDNLDESSELYWKGLNSNFEIQKTSVVEIKYLTEVSFKERKLEKVIEVEESLNPEKREDFSQRKKERIIIDDIDEFGLIVEINNQEFKIDSTIIFDSEGDIDLPESIDKTLKNWVNSHKYDLNRKGIIVSLDNFSEGSFSYLNNSLLIETQYPNIPLEVKAKVGTTANLFFLDRIVTFNKIGDRGSLFSIEINKRTFSSKVKSSISETIERWIQENKFLLGEFGITIEQKGESILIKRKENFEVSLGKIFTGKNFTRGERVFEVLEYSKGREGLIISSNQIRQKNPDIDLEEECFSTGQIISINNSHRQLNNQEYNIIFLDPGRIILSYQGPFWGSEDQDLQNAFFNLSFGEELNVGDKITSTSDQGEITGEIVKVSPDFYSVLLNNNVFKIKRKNAFGFDPNQENNISVPMEEKYKINELFIEELPKDIDFVNLNNEFFILSNDRLEVIDGESFRIKNSFDFPKDTIKTSINPVNNFLYILSSDSIFIFDPLNNKLIEEIPTIGLGWDMTIDTITGNSYISHINSDRILKITKEFSTTSFDYLPGYFFGELTYNRDDKKIYVFTRKNNNTSIVSDKAVYRIDTSDDSIRDLSFFIDSPETNSIGVGSNFNSSDLFKDKEIHYNPFNGDLYLNNDTSLHRVDKSNESLIDLGVSLDSYYSIALDSFSKNLWVSTGDGKLHRISENNIVRTFDISVYGYLLYNPKDSNLYIASQDGSNQINVFSTLENKVFEKIQINKEFDKIIFNKINDSIVGIDKNSTEITEIFVDFILQNYEDFSNIVVSSKERLTTEVMEVEPENELGGEITELSKDFIYIKTREFIRRPRKNYNTSGAPKVNWDVTLEDTTSSDIFIFDITTDHIKEGLQYTGERPLPQPTLKKTPNTDPEKVEDSRFQQTIFDDLSFKLDYNDSQENVSFVPEGLQVFLGYNSKQEGVDEATFTITQKEDISVDFKSYESFNSPTFSVSLPEQFLEFSHNKETSFGEISLNENSTDTFLSVLDLKTFEKTNTNLNEGQLIEIKVSDPSGESPFSNNNDRVRGRIKKIFKKKLVLEYTSDIIFTNETTKKQNSQGGDIYLDTNIEVIDKRICEIQVKGQTEIEDPRYRTELSNTGKLINPNDVYIFREYDVKEGGVDYTFINQKRKEMIHVRNEIFNYIGAYKSIINSINLFGYNDLELREYFENINPDSEEFKKLTAVDIPDIFDNSVDGWSENYKFWQFPNENYQETKLFNLFYRLTDFNGNKISSFSLDEVIIKLRGLKRWLENNVVPITHEILDITGRVDFKHDLQIYNTPSMVKEISIKDEISPVEFFINESYLMPVESGSEVFTTKVEFSVGDEELKPEFFELNIRTYQTFKEWEPFENYNLGDKVKFDGKIFENVFIDPTIESIGGDIEDSINKNNNPNFYEETEFWSSDNEYKRGDIVKYKRDIYLFSPINNQANYLPFLGAQGVCVQGTPSKTNSVDDNFFGDLSDSIFQENFEKSYFNLPEDRQKIDFDILDTIKEEIPNQWCDLINRDESVIENLAVILINTPEDNYQGEKPQNLEEAKDEIRNLIEDFEVIKEGYKFKFIDLDPEENIQIDNEDFILWEKITKWREVDLTPVQKIKEYRSGKDMTLPFNFTIDSSIDPFVVVSVVSSNGYGQVKNIEKSFEITFDGDRGEILNTNLRYQNPQERFSSIKSNIPE